MATRNQVLSMFGATPAQVLANQRQKQAEMIMSQRDPFAKTGAALGTALAGLFGSKTPELQRAEKLQQTLQSVNMESPDEMVQAAEVLRQAGFPSEAMQLLSRADQFRTSQVDRERSQAAIDLSEQQKAASQASVKRGLLERVDETISQPVVLDGQTFYVPVKAKVQYNKETGARQVLTSADELKQMAQQSAQKMQREELAAQSEATLRETQLTAAKKQATLAEAQLTTVQKKAGETTGLVRVPVERNEFDPLTQRTKKVTGFEYKATTGTMTTDENGKEIFVPNMQLPPEAEVVDDNGLPQGAIEIKEGEQITIESRGQEFVKIGAGQDEKFYQVITEGGRKYYLPTNPPVDPGTIYATTEEEQTQSSLGRKGQMSRGTTMTAQPVISSTPRTRRNR